MCGLFGAVSSALTPVERDLVVDLGTVSELRGRHSTGLICVSRQGRSLSVDWAKNTINAANFLQTDDVDELFRQRPFIIAGHCRHATVGSITAKNAHPFQEGHIVGMHNGTLYAGMREGQGDMTDSQRFFKALSEKGLQAAVDDIRGAYAFVWVDQKEATLNILRNEQRTLFTMNGGGTTYWASEAAMLELIKSRTFGRVFSNPEPVPVNEHICINLKNVHSYRQTPVKPKPFTMPALYDKSIFEKKKEEVEEEHKGPFIPMTASQAALAEKLRSSKKNGKTSTEKDTSSTVLSDTTVMGPSATRIKDYKPIRFGYRGYRGQIIDKDKAKSVLLCGCSYCDKSALLIDRVYFYNNKSFLCEKCADREASVEFVGAKKDDLWFSKLMRLDVPSNVKENSC